MSDHEEEIQNVKKSEKVSRSVSVFESTLHKSESWITEMKAELNWLSNDRTYHLLRAVLHSLREQLSVDEAAHFSAQLPLLLRGTFFECWNPKKDQPKGLTKVEFLESVRSNLNQTGQLEYDLELGVSVALGVIMNHISAGEVEDVVQSLKPSLKTFFKMIENFNIGRTYQ